MRINTEVNTLLIRNASLTLCALSTTKIQDYSWRTEWNWIICIGTLHIQVSSIHMYCFGTLQLCGYSKRSLLQHFFQTWWDIHAYSNILKILPPKNENFQIKYSAVIYISAPSIDCGYSLEPPRQGGSYEYSQSMFLSRNKKIMYTPVNPNFTV